MRNPRKTGPDRRLMQFLKQFWRVQSGPSWATRTGQDPAGSKEAGGGIGDLASARGVDWFGSGSAISKGVA